MNICPDLEELSSPRRVFISADGNLALPPESLP